MWKSLFHASFRKTSKIYGNDFLSAVKRKPANKTSMNEKFRTNRKQDNKQNIGLFSKDKK